MRMMMQQRWLMPCYEVIEGQASSQWATTNEYLRLYLKIERGPRPKPKLQGPDSTPHSDPYPVSTNMYDNYLLTLLISVIIVHILSSCRTILNTIIKSISNGKTYLLRSEKL